MAYNYDVAVKGIERTIMDMQRQAAQKQALQNSVSKSQAANPLNDPMQMIMLQEYIRQNPEAAGSFDAVLGGGRKEGIFDKSKTVPGMDPFTPQSNGPGQPANQSPAGPASPGVPATDVFTQKRQPDVVMGKDGFRMQVPSHKDFIFEQIQNKERAGHPLDQSERKFKQKYLGISTSKDGPKTAADRLKIREMAKTMARDAAQSVLSPEEVAAGAGDSYEPTEDQISNFILDAAQYLYPNLDIEDGTSLISMMSNKKPGEDEDFERALAGVDKYAAKTKSGKTVELDIKLPGYIKKASQALKYLIDQGMSEQEAKEWLSARLKK